MSLTTTTVRVKRMDLGTSTGVDLGTSSGARVWNWPVLWLSLLALFWVWGSLGCAGAQPRATEEQRRAAEINAELGISYLRQGDLMQAERALDRALQFDANLALVQLGLAALRERQGLLDEAVSHYQKALKIDPGNPYVQTNLGDVECRRGNIAEGKRLLEQATRNPSYPARQVALASLAHCYSEVGAWDRAEDYLRQALRFDPQYPDALWELARLNFHQGQPFQTRAFLSRLKGLGVVTPAALLLCYRAEMQLGNPQDAKRCADQLRFSFGETEEAAELFRWEQSGG